MTSLVRTERRDGTAFLILSSPPVNAFGAALRTAFQDAFRAAEADPEVHEIVLIGEGKGFSAGADIAEFDAPLTEPSLPALCNMVEAAAKPVIAAMHGFTLAGGFELALSAHYRVADAQTRVGLPEVNIGVLPGAGGTQRLPRIVGAGPALRVMLTGQPVPATHPTLTGLVDRIASGNLPETAMAFCRELRAAGKGPRPTRDRRDGFAKPQAYAAELARSRETIKGSPEPARAEIVTLVEMAQMVPFDVGLSCEWDAFQRMLATPQSAALRYLFFAERLAAKLPVPDGLAPPKVDRVAVLGGGPMAMHTTVAMLNAGFETRWGTRDPQHLQAGLGQLASLYREAEKQGRITAEQAKARMAGLRTGRSEDMARDADVAVLAAKGQTGIALPEGAVRIHAQPGEVTGLGMRFAPPAYSNRLVEVIAGERVTGQEMAAAAAVVRRLGKMPVLVRSSGESLVSRLFDTMFRAADALVEMGADLYLIDDAMAAWGWKRPPFAMRDGLGLHETASAWRAEGARNLAQVLMAAGRKGRGPDHGFYRYENGTAVRDPAIPAALKRLRIGDAAAKLRDDDLAWLIVGAMANDGLRMLETGMIARVSDIDAALVVGHDFPRWRGGPMKAVSQHGLLTLSRRMAELKHPDTKMWDVRPAWRECIKNGRGLETL